MKMTPITQIKAHLPQLKGKHAPLQLNTMALFQHPGDALLSTVTLQGILTEVSRFA